MSLESVERWIQWIGGAAVLVPLGAVLLGLFRGLRRPSGRVSGRTLAILRAPLFYLVATVGYFGLCYLIWRPLPLRLSPPTRVGALLLGVLLYFPGLALILWGRLTLGKMYFVSCTFGASLYADHRLVTEGPFALVRHPMYLGIALVGLGGLLIYRTWTFAFFTANFFGLIFRARREEQALAAEFGEQWEEYCRQVPAWIPHLRDRMR